MPSIEDNYPIDYLTHRAFAASIGPNQRYNFTGIYIQVSIREGYNTAVALDDIMGRKRHGHSFLLEVSIQNFLFAQNIIEQVSIRFVGADGDCILEVILGYDHGDR